MRPRTFSASTLSGSGYGNTSSSWISPSTSALANEVTSVVAAACASAVTGPLLLELAGELERQDHGGGEDHHDADADHQPRADQVAEDAHDEAQDHQRDERARLGPRAVVLVDDVRHQHAGASIADGLAFGVA